MEYLKELQKTDLKTRNRVRAIVTLPANKARGVLNTIRKQVTPSKLAQVDRVLWVSPGGNGPLIPELFPTTPQTREGYNRLHPLSLPNQLKVIECHLHSSLEVIGESIEALARLNDCILRHQHDDAVDVLDKFICDFGYSHLVLRKAALLGLLSDDQRVTNVTEGILKKAGLDRGNAISSSLIYCYREDAAFLNLKKSIMGLRDRGDKNKFTRDISRIPFHPHCNDSDDLRDVLQSAMQSSLIDALILAKFNQKLFRSSDYPRLAQCFEDIETCAPSVQSLVRWHNETSPDSELTFYSRSSAWLESVEIADYRLLIDHFYDDPDAPYLGSLARVANEVADSISVNGLDELATSERMVEHGSEELAKIQQGGNVTRAALFNYFLFITKGFDTVEERNLVWLMSKTSSLARTISIDFAANLARSVGSETSKLILYLLIAKKSRNERDEYSLRKIVQDVTTNRHNGDLVNLLNHLESLSSEVAVYAYEVFTEDFIAKLYHLIDTSSQITETRADMHVWMGRHTGEKFYTDRARTLLIDHQLNKVRNEIDDNRIYVDVARFQQWIDDELAAELSFVLAAAEQAAFVSDAPDSILRMLIERCYLTFCSHSTFGIASYLGRRIRHGTFKGHLYSGVVKIADDEQFEELLADPVANKHWQEWKRRYEKQIDSIMQDRLHVASSSKRLGLLNPSVLSQPKVDTIAACERSLTKDFSEKGSVVSAASLITEYCWRLAEFDLRSFNAFLKSQRRTLAEGLHEFASAVSQPLRSDANALHRAVDRAIGKRQMAMQDWFKRPQNVSPKASVSLLYKAVAEEVRETYPSLSSAADTDPDQDITLLGEAYHVLYDALYVLVFNAAKHGKVGGSVIPRFKLNKDDFSGQSSIKIEIISELCEGDDPVIVKQRLAINPDVDVQNAHVYENRSGIPKLHQLQASDSNFLISEITCERGYVRASFIYLLEY